MLTETKGRILLNKRLLLACQLIKTYIFPKHQTKSTYTAINNFIMICHIQVSEVIQEGSHVSPQRSCKLMLFQFCHRKKKAMDTAVLKKSKLWSKKQVCQFETTGILLGINEYHQYYKDPIPFNARYVNKIITV